MCYDCSTESSNQAKNHHRLGVTRRPNGDPSSPSNYWPDSPNVLTSEPTSSTIANPHWTPVSPLIKQASDCTTPRQTTQITQRPDPTVPYPGGGGISRWRPTHFFKATVPCSPFPPPREVENTARWRKHNWTTERKNYDH